MRPVEEVPDADWDRIFAINVGAAFALSRACVFRRCRPGIPIDVGHPFRSKSAGRSD
jgi:NAD(P)-dependent dehydrogenase (short-subunit alcohol dehydrogenase family)